MFNREMNRKEDDLLDRATAALRDADVPPGPSDQLLSQTLAKLESAETTPIESPHSRRILSMKTILKLAVAACVAIVLGTLVWNWPTHKSSLAFGDVIKQVEQANALRFKMTTLVDLPNAPKQKVDSTVTSVGGRIKHQSSQDIVMLMDFDAGEMLTVMSKQKQAMRMKMLNVPEQAKNMNLQLQFRKLKSDQAKELGTKEIGGATLHGFEVQNGPQIMKVWADPKTERPVLIETTMDMPGGNRGTAVMKDFEWDVAVDPAEMTLTVPEGYTVRDVNVDASPATEMDLIESLRAMATLNGGKFPDAFDMAGLSSALQRNANAATRPGTDQTRKERETSMMTSAMKASRGMTFINVGSGSDFHYAGKGLSLNDAGRPVFWYQPKGSQTYRVIDAALQVSEVAADALPQIESIEMKAGASPYPPAATTPAR